MSVTFKCKATGNTVTFKNPVDIESTRQHPEYEEIVTIEEVKQRGRPRKEVIVDDTDTDSI